MKTNLRILVVSVLVLAACGGAAGDTTTTGPAATPTTAAGGGADTTPDATPDTTAPAEPSTTAASPTTQATPDVDADEIVANKTAAVEAAAPEDWTAETGPQDEFTAGEDFPYEVCSIEEEFDIDTLDAVTSGVLLTNLEGPSPNPPFPGARGSVEARVMESEAVAEEAFAVFERLYGSQEGLECLTDVVLDTLGDEAPTNEINITVEEVLVSGAQAGARFEMTFDIDGFDGGFYVEFQGARHGSCMVIASFITFGEPMDRNVADDLFSAAVNA